MSEKSVKLYWSHENITAGNVLPFLFGDRKETLDTARELIGRMKSNTHLAMTRREMRLFAKGLENGSVGVKYSYHNFYVKLLKKLIELGFIERDVLIWDEKKRKTEAVYQLKLQAIPERPPQGGFVKQTWQIARGWNEYIRAPGTEQQRKPEQFAKGITA
jgi:hypothetical protein